MDSIGEKKEGSEERKFDEWMDGRGERQRERERFYPILNTLVFGNSGAVGNARRKVCTGTVYTVYMSGWNIYKLD